MASTPTSSLATRHLLGLQGMSAPHLCEFLHATRELDADAPDVTHALAGRSVANLFFEDSTRTRGSFSVAAARLGASVVDLLGSTLSISKGETLIDTACNVEAMGVSALIVRARQAGSSRMISRAVKIPVINAGDGKHEHPTQGLLDIYTLAEAHGRLEDFSLKGLTIAIVGDVASSRVARSDIAGMRTLGANVICIGPPGMAPKSLESLGCKVAHELDPILPKADAVMMLRIQFERHGESAKNPGAAGSGEGGKSPTIASVREFRERFGLTAARADRMKPGAVVMHPGPINRGIELDAQVADGPRSLILRQVSVGVLVRMAVLKALVHA